jgi:hypothetical protein
MNKDIHNIFENYLLIEGTEPELLSRDIYKASYYINRLGLEYHFKHKKNIFSILLPVEVDKNGAFKTKNDMAWRVWVFKISKKIRFAMEAQPRYAIPLTGFNFNPDLELKNLRGVEQYDLEPLINMFYSIAKQDIKEHNNTVLFNGDQAASDTFGDLYDEL